MPAEPMPLRAQPGRTRIGWIGTGVMGAAMAGHLIRAGYEVSVTTRTRERAEPLLDAGATWVDEPAAIAAQSDIVVTMVGFPDEVRAVLLGPNGALVAARPGTVVVDMSTNDPTLTVELAETGRAKGVHVLDAPVSGGDVGARAGTLSIMVGGDADAFAAVLPCFEAMGSTVVHQGGPGAGQRTKLVNQVLVADTMVGVCEALLYAHRTGLDVDRVLESVATGAAGSWGLSNLGPRIIAGDFAPGFLVDHLVKDLGLVLADADRVGLRLPGLALAHELYLALQEQGRGRDGTQSLVHALAAVSDLSWPPAATGSGTPPEI
ncbi:MAG TPA: NAD(P)-dependent oxidoreductase [Acidimicrobiales bacterium]